MPYYTALSCNALLVYVSIVIFFRDRDRRVGSPGLGLLRPELQGGVQGEKPLEDVHPLQQLRLQGERSFLFIMLQFLR